MFPDEVQSNKQKKESKSIGNHRHLRAILDLVMKRKIKIYLCFVIWYQPPPWRSCHSFQHYC